MATSFELRAREDEAPESAPAQAAALFGKPGPFPLRRDGKVTVVRGWVVGRGRAECRDGDSLVTWVHLDLLLTDEARYLTCERVGSQRGTNISIPVTTVTAHENSDALREHCEAAVDDPLRAAVRCAALDDASRRWPPLKAPPRRAHR